MYLKTGVFSGLLAMIWIANACTTSSANNEFFEDISRSQFNDYWYNHQAELTSYKLEQARYGEIHEGTAVFIFVTEPFSKKKQVKLDNPDGSEDKVSVLKLNATRKFNTGIYPYSMMTSIFTPVKINEYPRSLKVTTSSQEWCGHTFTQLNLEENQYRVRGFSYFESEGDVDYKMQKTWLEDELWTRIKLDPATLPTGEVDLVPGTIYQRLKHTDLKPGKAELSLEEEGKWMHYSVDYKDFDRELKITFSKAFPYEIVSWQETYTSGWGESAKVLTTKATKLKTLKTDYWNKHDVEDASYREKLGL